MINVSQINSSYCVSKLLSRYIEKCKVFSMFSKDLYSSTFFNKKVDIVNLCRREVISVKAYKNIKVMRLFSCLYSVISAFVLTVFLFCLMQMLSLNLPKLNTKK